MMNCPNCQQALSRQLGEMHCECGCGSIVILPHGQAHRLGGTLKRLAKRHGVAFDGSDLRGGIAVTKAIQGVRDAVKAFATEVKGLGDLQPWVGLGGHKSKQITNQTGEAS
jgi:hypothetical protein